MDEEIIPLSIEKANKPYVTKYKLIVLQEMALF